MITHLVSLVTHGGSKGRKIMIGAPIFNESKCGGKPETSKEFKNSVGNSTAQLEILLPGIHQAQSPSTCTGHTPQVTALPELC